MLGIGAFLLFLIHRIMKFIRANGDMNLLSKSQVPKGAFKDRVVWIVGASRGLGEAMALHFAKEGSKMVLSARGMEGLERVKASCRKSISEDDIVLLPLDVTSNSEEIEAAASRAFEAFDGAGIDYVVLNAGASQHAAVEDTSYEVASTLLRLNLEGPLAIARATLPMLLRRGKGGRLVVISR